MRLMLLLLGIVLGIVLSGAAEAKPLLCSAVKIGGGYAMDEAVAAVFPKSQPRSTSDDCANPLQLLRYGDADVLLTTKGPPDGVLCHGCGGVLSAFVLRRGPEGPKPVSRFLDFVETGSNGNPGVIDAIQFAGHDAFSVESGGTFQGYSKTLVNFFVFRNGRLDEIKPALPLEASNGGAMVDDAKVKSVKGAWHIDPARPDMVTIDYLTSADGQRRRSSATWVLKDATLNLSGGQVPAEYASAGGE